mmetsp:Transcript_33499/g.71804  ORF Transcript_33499/g.71804 Transcript_33499/m.71804 type:complete len:185 (-) Transcript_33499:8-562(-)
MSHISSLACSGPGIHVCGLFSIKIREVRLHDNNRVHKAQICRWVSVLIVCKKRAQQRLSDASSSSSALHLAPMSECQLWVGSAATRPPWPRVRSRGIAPSQEGKPQAPEQAAAVERLPELPGKPAKVELQQCCDTRLPPLASRSRSLQKQDQLPRIHPKGPLPAPSGRPRRSTKLRRRKRWRFR